MLASERGEQWIFKLSAKTTYDRMTRTLSWMGKHPLKPMCKSDVDVVYTKK
ncbi:MAG: hypothetical protein ACLUPL_09045 [Butyricimonas virosa]